MAKKVVHKIASVVERASHYSAVLAGALIVLLAWIVTYSVVKRYVFHAPDPYVYEISAMLLLWCVVLAVPAVEKLDRHIRMDLFVNILPQKVRDISYKVMGPALGLFYCIILVWKGLDNAFYALKFGEVSSSAWAVPLSPIKFVVPAGYALLGLVLIVNLFRGLASLWNSKKKTEE
jgi:TRAP-type C4-dicarboxylate transport system permease small subunit